MTLNPVALFIATEGDNERVLTALNGRDLNKSSLADIANVGYSIVHRADMGLYDTIPPKLNAYMKSINPNRLWNVLYLNYKKALLGHRKELVSPRVWLKTSTKKYESWTEFREIVADSQMEFAKLFLISPAILQHYESGRTKFLPIVIMKRLEYFGMDPEDIRYLADLPVGERTIWLDGKDDF